MRIKISAGSSNPLMSTTYQILQKSIKKCHKRIDSKEVCRLFSIEQVYAVEKNLLSGVQSGARSYSFIDFVDFLRHIEYNQNALGIEGVH